MQVGCQGVSGIRPNPWLIAAPDISPCHQTEARHRALRGPVTVFFCVTSPSFFVRAPANVST